MPDWMIDHHVKLKVSIRTMESTLRRASVRIVYLPSFLFSPLFVFFFLTPTPALVSSWILDSAHIPQSSLRVC